MPESEQHPCGHHDTHRAHQGPGDTGEHLVVNAESPTTATVDTGEPLAADQAIVGERSAAGLALASSWRQAIVVVWAGQAISFVTSGAAGFALIWYLVETTGSPFILSLASVIFFLPVILLGPLAGAFVDRHDRKHIMILADLGIAFMSLVTGALIFVGYANVPLVLVMMAVRSLGVTFHGPAMMAAMPLLVPERHLVRISTLDQGLQGLSNIGAPALGILFYTTLGLPFALLLDAAGAIVACVALVFVRIPRAQLTREERTGLLSEMRDGIAAIRRRHGMTVFFVLIFVCTAAFMPMAALFPLLTTLHFGGDGYAASLVEAVWGIGFVLGSLILGIWGGGKKLIPLIIASVIACGAFTLACGFLPPDAFFVFVVLTGFMALSGAFFNSPTLAVIQKNIEPKKLGRVMAVFGSLSGIAAPVGLLISGPVAEFVGVPPIFVASGAGMILTVCAGCFFPSVFSLDKGTAADGAENVEDTSTPRTASTNKSNDHQATRSTS
ncbi:MAG: MFS transporter [Coriobacteriales bacterium]|jgi:DHA3 family macrolide efflux protein-like MFS transporter|nr:MFS transporter [Coriobacteriales bacterium]